MKREIINSFFFGILVIIIGNISIVLLDTLLGLFGIKIFSIIRKKNGVLFLTGILIYIIFTYEMNITFIKN